MLRTHHASTLTAAAKIQPIEFQNQRAVPIRSLVFSPVDGRPHPVSVSMVHMARQTDGLIANRHPQILK